MTVTNYDEDTELEDKISRLLVALRAEHQHGVFLPEETLELIDWIEDWFESRS